MKKLFLDDWNANIAYHDLNQGPITVIYLAGLNMPVLPNFEAIVGHKEISRHRAILVNYLGTGGSDHAKDFSHTMQDHARTVINVLDKEGIKNCVLVGHSMGGTVGIYLSIMRPDLVSHLIVGEGNLMPGGGTATKEFSSYSEQDFTETFFPKQMAAFRKAAQKGDAIAKRLYENWADVDSRGIHRSSCALVNLEAGFKQMYFDLPMKRTFILGEKSIEANKGKPSPDLPDTHELRENGIDVAVLPDAGHALMWANPDGFVEILNRALVPSE